MNNTNVNIKLGGSTGLMSLLFVLFLALKLTHVIAWSWWWIFAPMWGPLAIFIAIMIIVFIVAVIEA